MPGQLLRPVRLRFKLPVGADIERLDAWMPLLLGSAAPAESAPDPISTDPVADLPWQWWHRLLLLGNGLLQAARIPAIASPQVLSCKAAPDRPGCWVGVGLIARIDGMPESNYALALKGAAYLAERANAQPAGDDGALQALFGWADEHILPKLRRGLPLGKSVLPVLRVAHRMGVPFTHIAGGLFQLGWGHHAVRLHRSVMGGDTAIGALLSASKASTAALLRQAGLPAPVHAVVKSAREAQAAAMRLGWPVVVKPVDRERGEGVVVDVGDDTTLAAACAAAFALSAAKEVIVERQVAGVCHRLFMAHGQLLYAVQRGPMAVDGDGVGTVAMLIDREVRVQRRLPPWERSGIQPLDALALAALQREGLAPDDVPAAGRRVPLRRIESTDWGGVDVDVTSAVHPLNLQLALQACEAMGLAVAGVDIICTDIARPWTETGAVINEVNFAPLLGGAAISRGYIPEFLRRLLNGAGKIPVHVLVGGDAAWQAAGQQWRALRASGLAACACRADLTLDSAGRVWPLAVRGLAARVRALVLNARVQAIVLVVQTDELLFTGLPLESVSSVTLVDAQLRSAKSSAEPLPLARVRALLALMRAWPLAAEHGIDQPAATATGVKPASTIA